MIPGRDLDQAGLLEANIKEVLHIVVEVRLRLTAVGILKHHSIIGKLITALFFFLKYGTHGRLRSASKLNCWVKNTFFSNIAIANLQHIADQ